MTIYLGHSFRVKGVIKSAGPPSVGWPYCLETFNRYN